ncbi:ABC transporter permease [Neisseria meningitidis]
MNGGEIIFADEPTGALDTASGKNVMEIIHKLHEAGHTVIMVTHDPGIAANANRVIEIRDGEIISDTSKNPVNPRKQCREDSGKSLVVVLLRPVCRSLQNVGASSIGAQNAFASDDARHHHRYRFGCLRRRIGQWFAEKILEDISSIGTNTISIFPGRGFGDRRSGRIKTLTIDDAKIIAKQSYVASATPMTSSGGTLTYRNTDLTASLYGVGEQYFDVRGLKLETGRLFDENDVKEDAQVVVIDQNVKDKLFADSDPLGKTILFRKRPLTVIGVMKKDENAFGNSDVLMLWSPYTTVMHQITGESHTNSITVKIKDNANTQVAEKGLTDLLKARHGTEDFFMNNSDSIRQIVESTTGTMKLLISSIALISLVVGGIGVMNIMLVSVTERTKEIGIRMAIGARRGNILQQFLIEAVLICVIGGLVGVGLSAAVSLVFNHFVTDFPMDISAASVIGAVACSTGIGIAFGFMPANKAAKLNPIDALAQD